MWTKPDTVANVTCNYALIMHLNFEVKLRLAVAVLWKQTMDVVYRGFILVIHGSTNFYGRCRTGCTRVSTHRNQASGQWDWFAQAYNLSNLLLFI